jgi:uncharacterized membrane protein YdjX (TVP38/TMEM64 family)
MPAGTFIVISTIGRLLGTLMLTIAGSCVRNEQYRALFILVGISAIIFIAAYLNRDKWLETLKRKTM